MTFANLSVKLANKTENEKTIKREIHPSQTPAPDAVDMIKTSIAWLPKNIFNTMKGVDSPFNDIKPNVQADWEKELHSVELVNKLVT